MTRFVPLFGLNVSGWRSVAVAPRRLLAWTIASTIACITHCIVGRMPLVLCFTVIVPYSLFRYNKPRPLGRSGLIKKSEFVGEAIWNTGPRSSIDSQKRGALKYPYSLPLHRINSVRHLGQISHDGSCHYTHNATDRVTVQIIRQIISLFYRSHDRLFHCTDHTTYQVSVQITRRIMSLYRSHDRSCHRTDRATDHVTVQVTRQIMSLYRSHDRSCHRTDHTTDHVTVQITQDGMSLMYRSCHCTDHSDNFLRSASRVQSWL